MTKITKTWTQITIDRMRASKARLYLTQVADGKVKGDPIRVRACEFILNKILANPPTAIAVHDAEGIPDFYVHHPQQD